MLFPGRYFRFGRPPNKFQWFQKWQAKKKSKVLLIFILFPFNFNFSSFPFTIFLLFFSIFSLPLFFFLAKICQWKVSRGHCAPCPLPVMPMSLRCRKRGHYVVLEDKAQTWIEVKWQSKQARSTAFGCTVLQNGKIKKKKKKSKRDSE